MSGKKKKVERRKFDWDKIEQAYRLGEKSIHGIAREHGLTEAYIRKKAKAEKWERDLTAKVRKATQAKLVRETVRAANIANQALTDRQIIEASSELRANLVLGHQKRISRLVSLADKLTAKLEAINDAEVCDLPSSKQAADVVERVTRTTTQLIALERQAYNMDAPVDAPQGAIGCSAVEVLMQRLATLSNREAEYSGGE